MTYCTISGQCQDGGSSKEVLGREREDQVVQQFEGYLTQMRKGSNNAHQVTLRESEILDLLRLGAIQ